MSDVPISLTRGERAFMWQSPSQRARALAAQKKREKERNKAPIHIKRIITHVQFLDFEGKEIVSDHAPEASVVLNDLTVSGIGLYSNSKLPIGQKVLISIEIPKRIEIRGEVIWSQEQFTGSHIIQSAPYNYRAGVQFQHQSPEVHQQLEAFCQELLSNYLFKKKVA